MNAAQLAVSFRQMSASRDRVVTGLDEGSTPSLRQLSLKRESPTLTPSFAPPTLMASSDLRSPLWTNGRERTINIGSSSRSKSTSPHGAGLSLHPTTLHFEHHHHHHQQQILQGDSGAFRFGSQSTLAPSGEEDLLPLSYHRLVPPPIVAAEDDAFPDAQNAQDRVPEDNFDRASAMQRAVLRSASPREYAPEYEDSYPLPQPDDIDNANYRRGGGDDTLQPDVFDRKMDPRANIISSTFASSMLVASPPPRLPPHVKASELQRQGSNEDQAQQRQAGGGSMRRIPSLPSISETQHSNTSNGSKGTTATYSGSAVAEMQMQHLPAPAAVMDFHGISVPVPPALALNAFNVVPAARSSSTSLPYRQLRPSKFLAALLEAVALRRGLNAMPAVPSEIIQAFDSVVRDGAYFIKYSSTGAPHERFFQIRFVDVEGYPPEPCLSWSVHRTSWSAKGLLNLATIRKVTSGTDTLAFQRHVIDAKKIRGPMIGGPHRAILPTSYAFFIEGPGTEGNEPLSLLSLSAEVFQAWIIFLTFCANLGLESGDAAISSENGSTGP